MKLFELEHVWTGDIEYWLEKNLNLTPEQSRKMHEDELIRSSPFYFFKKRKEKSDHSNILWRLTIILIPFYIIAMYIFVFLRFILTGKKHLSDKFILNFHKKWMSKVKLNL